MDSEKASTHLLNSWIKRVRFFYYTANAVGLTFSRTLLLRTRVISVSCSRWRKPVTKAVGAGSRGRSLVWKLVGLRAGSLCVCWRLLMTAVWRR